MSERSSISLAEVLGENYYIDKLTSSEYSPAVGDTVTITLSVNDVFGDPATGQTRTVTCSSGQFVSVNGSSITASDSVEVTTGSGGTVTLGLSVSVADNIIVSDGRCDCVVCSLSNSITNILQYREVATFQSDKIKVFANSFSGCILINGTFTVTANNVTKLCTIPSQYKPPNAITMPCNDYQTVHNYISIWNSSGDVNIRNRGSETSVNAYNIVYYPLPSRLD